MAAPVEEVAEAVVPVPGAAGEEAVVEVAAPGLVGVGVEEAEGAVASEGAGAAVVPAW